MAQRRKGGIRQPDLIPRSKQSTIGTIKGQKYGFNHPAARSAGMMGVCGQRAALGFNLTKRDRGIAEPPAARLIRERRTCSSI